MFGRPMTAKFSKPYPPTSPPLTLPIPCPNPSPHSFPFLSPPQSSTHHNILTCGVFEVKPKAILTFKGCGRPEKGSSELNDVKKARFKSNLQFEIQ